MRRIAKFNLPPTEKRLPMCGEFFFIKMEECDRAGLKPSLFMVTKELNEEIEIILWDKNPESMSRSAFDKEMLRGITDVVLFPGDLNSRMNEANKYVE